MEESSSAPAGRTRTKGPESTARSEALRRLKALRSCTNCRRSDSSNIQIKLWDPIYDTVPESEYAALVAKRRDNFRDFIVGDDGLGYTDDGQEEDWSDPNPDYHSDSGSAGYGSSKKKEDKTRKPPPDPVARRHRISSMFTSSVFRKNERTPKAGILGSDGILDDVLAEFAPNENDREERRRRSFRNVPHMNGSSRLEEKFRENGCLSHENDGYSPVALEVKREQPEGNNNTQADKCDSDVEMRAEEETKEFCLNAENIEAQMKENVLSAMEGSCGRDDGRVGCEGAIIDSTSVNIAGSSDLSLSAADGKLQFYFVDAHEESFGGNAGTIYLFGKVKAGGAYHSCCVVVKNMQRCIYAIPDSSVFPSIISEDTKMDSKESEDPSPSLQATLQDMASGLKSEIAERLLKLNVSNFTMLPVKRNYAFERTDIPAGKQYVLKINYPFKDPPLPADLKGDHFKALLGTHNSALELFLTKKKIKGPSWLSISRFFSCPPSQQVSWCKFEIVVDCPKDISVSLNPLDVPQLIVAAINLKTIISTKHNSREIVAASLVCCNKVKIDGPMSLEGNGNGVLSHFTVVRKLVGGIFPMGLQKYVAERNLKAGSNILTLESSERALINRLMIELHKLDCDVLVGHNISGFDLDVLLHRAQACKVPSSMWSKIGRLKRSVMPKLSRSRSLYGCGASIGIMSCIAGRLLCDTYLCSRDLLKEVSYSLTHLAKIRLKRDRIEITPHDIHEMFEDSATLLKLVEHGETDGWLSLALMFDLAILPLTWQLTIICGNLWGKNLQGARAQRVEYLLLHSFRGKKYMVPDKVTAQVKESNTTKRKLTVAVTGDNVEETNANGITPADDEHHVDRGKRKMGPTYAGGLVLEPKKGLYDKYVLLLDFNSLYPSIIQEYNICFTTVERGIDGQAPNLPLSNDVGVLPKLLEDLVAERTKLKLRMKGASGVRLDQLDIQQQALKLTANSIYGCLGFSNSRFYAKPLAELITLQGREILQNTVDFVQNNLNLEVIYGDTDSIMIYTGLDDIAKAKSVATKVIKQVNGKYHCLKIDLDGLYKRMLLLKKKKYAAVKVEFKDGTLYEVTVCKGLDMVRRDWSLLSKKTGGFCLDQIFFGSTCEEVVESIHRHLTKVREEMKSGQITLENYVITKSLTKAPEDYPDAKNQPHVQVALRRKKNGHSGCCAGDTVPYVICRQQGASSGSLGIAQRARHPDELDKSTWMKMIDIDYYLSQQVNDDDKRYHGCEPLWLSCPSCCCTFECPPTSSLLSTLSNESTTGAGEKKQADNFWHSMRCMRCPDEAEAGRISPSMIANQVKRQAEKFISLYYKGTMICGDEMCKQTTRTPNLRVIGDSERGMVCPNYQRCDGHLVRQYSEADLYRQLSYFCYILDTKGCIEKVDQKYRALAEREHATARCAVKLAASVMQKVRDRCAYGWVQLKDLAVSV